MNFFRGNIVLGRLAPSFWRNTQTLAVSRPVVKRVIGPTPGQIGNMFRQMQRLGKRGGVADMLQETRWKFNTLKADTKTFGVSARRLFTNYSNGGAPHPARDVLIKALAWSVGMIVASWLVFPWLFRYTPLKVLAQRPDWLISSIIGINVAVFLLWKTVNPSIYRLMFDNFLLKPGPAFRPFQLIGSAFSHQELGHIAVNMFVLYQFGIPVAMTMGSAWFCHMYLTSAVASSFASLVVPTLLGRMIMSLGASGAVFGVMGVFCSVFPDASIGLFFIPLPFGAWYFFLGSIGVNAMGLVRRWGNIDYAGHLGGSFAGLYFGWRVNQIRAQQRERLQRERGFGGFGFR